MHPSSEVSHAAIIKSFGESSNNNTTVQPLAFPPEQAARILGYSVSWLAKARLKKSGPEFIKGPKKVLYELAALQRWMDTQKRYSSTAEYIGGAK
jgi:hypothetical protein